MALVEHVLLLANGSVEAKELVRLLPVPLQSVLLLFRELESIELNVCVCCTYDT